MDANHRCCSLPDGFAEPMKLSLAGASCWGGYRRLLTYLLGCWI